MKRKPMPSTAPGVPVGSCLRTVSAFEVVDFDFDVAFFFCTGVVSLGSLPRDVSSSSFSDEAESCLVLVFFVFDCSGVLVLGSLASGR